MNLYKYIDQPVSLQIILALQKLKQVKYSKKSELLASMPFKVSRTTFRRHLTNLILRDQAIKVDMFDGYKVMSLATNTNKAIAKPTKTKQVYAEHDGVKVKLTENEYTSLIQKDGEQKTKAIIEFLLNYKVSSGKKYASDYGAINNWVRSRVEKDMKSTQIDQYGYRDKAHINFRQQVLGGSK